MRTMLYGISVHWMAIGVGKKDMHLFQGHMMREGEMKEQAVQGRHGGYLPTVPGACR